MFLHTLFPSTVCHLFCSGIWSNIVKLFLLSYPLWIICSWNECLEIQIIWTDWLRGIHFVWWQFLYQLLDILSYIDSSCWILQGVKKSHFTFHVRWLACYICIFSFSGIQSMTNQLTKIRNTKNGKNRAFSIQNVGGSCLPLSSFLVYFSLNGKCLILSILPHP